MERLLSLLDNTDSSEIDIKEEFSAFVGKEHTPKSIAELVRLCNERANMIVSFPDSIDLCGTGWSKNPLNFNTSSTLGILLAKHWTKVAKHWNGSATSNSWSLEFLEEMGIDINADPEQLRQSYIEWGFAFLNARKIYPFLWRLAKVRKSYWQPTIFNILGPWLAPGNPKSQLIGCAFEDKIDLMLEASRLLWRDNVLIVRWNDWLDEVSPRTDTTAALLREWKIRKFTIEPGEYHVMDSELTDLNFGDITARTETAAGIISGRDTTSVAARLVLLNREVVEKCLLS